MSKALFSRIVHRNVAIAIGPHGVLSQSTLLRCHSAAIVALMDQFVSHLIRHGSSIDRASVHTSMAPLRMLDTPPHRCCLRDLMFAKHMAIVANTLTAILPLKRLHSKPIVLQRKLNKTDVTVIRRFASHKASSLISCEYKQFPLGGTEESFNWLCCLRAFLLFHQFVFCQSLLLAHL